MGCCNCAYLIIIIFLAVANFFMVPIVLCYYGHCLPLLHEFRGNRTCTVGTRPRTTTLKPTLPPTPKPCPTPKHCPVIEDPECPLGTLPPAEFYDQCSSKGYFCGDNDMTHGSINCTIVGNSNLTCCNIVDKLGVRMCPKPNESNFDPSENDDDDDDDDTRRIGKLSKLRRLKIDPTTHSKFKTSKIPDHLEISLLNGDEPIDASADVDVKEPDAELELEEPKTKPKTLVLHKVIATAIPDIGEDEESDEQVTTRKQRKTHKA